MTTREQAEKLAGPHMLTEVGLCAAVGGQGECFCSRKSTVEEIEKALEGICEHGNSIPDPDCGCGV